MEKKFINSSDLGEILEDIAKKAMEHSDKASTHVTFRRNEMTVSVWKTKMPNEILSSQTYIIIDNIQDSINVLDDVFGDALIALEQLSIIKTDNNNQQTK